MKHLRHYRDRSIYALLEAAPDAMLIVDARGSVVLMNAQLERMFGYTRGELLGRSMDALIPHRFRAAHDRHRAAFAQARIPRPMAQGRELQALHKDGSEFPVEISLSPSGHPRRPTVTAAIRDVSERHRYEEELCRARREAESANAAKSIFLAHMSHELRTPIGVIQGFAELLADHSLGDDERKDFTQRIRSNADHLVILINDVLDLAKAEAGRIDVERRPFLLAPFVDDLVGSMRVKISTSGVVLRVKIDASAPQTIVTDETRLRQIVANMLANALKFTKVGYVELNVESTAATKPTVAFTVEDTGCGVASTSRDRIFEPFAQGSAATTRQYGGTGLGLSISRRLARALGGDLVLADSVPGQGSTFTATIAG